MDVVYEVLDSLHVFIPVIAIVACVVIFVCGMRSSKSAQPPDEYLQEIKANAAKIKTKNKSSKSSSPLTSSPKSENYFSEKNAKTHSSSNEIKKEKPKVLVETKKAKKLTKNSSEEAADDKAKVVKDGTESTPWVTVTPKRKQKESSVTSNSVKNVIHDVVSSGDDEPKKISSEENPKVEEQIQPKPDKVINEAEPEVERQVPAPPIENSLDAAIEDDEVWSVQTGKDSRYRKTKKRLGSKNEIQNEDIFSSPQSESFSNPEIDQKQSNEARRRRNVRRDN